MMIRFWSLIIVTVGWMLAGPGWAAAAEHGEAPLAVPWWSVLPFALLLLSIAVLPLAVGHWWHKNRNKALVTAGVAGGTTVLLAILNFTHDGRILETLLHEMLQGYLPFIILLASLYTVSGGIVLEGDIEGKPRTNALILAVGAVLANFIGTTGASMLLIRTFLRINHQRKHTHHLPVFFIFMVSNLGGLLTPLGDPPLFLGFKRGIVFSWTLTLWPQWLLANGLLLAIFFVWDWLAYRREQRPEIRLDQRQIHPLRLFGLHNLIFLAGIVLAVLIQSEPFGQAVGSWFGMDLTLTWPWGELMMLVMAVLAYVTTKPNLRKANHFEWGAIFEVAILFVGIFVTMVPALALLSQLGGLVTRPWQYFWMTGALSSFLDNAPTYLAFAAMASGDPENLRGLMEGSRAASWRRSAAERSSWARTPTSATAPTSWSRRSPTRPVSRHRRSWAT